MENYILGAEPPPDMLRNRNALHEELQEERFSNHLIRYHQHGCRECEPGARRNTLLGHGKDSNDYIYDLTCSEIDEFIISKLPPDLREAALARYLAKCHQEACEECRSGPKEKRGGGN
jgi:hypothetical protein